MKKRNSTAAITAVGLMAALVFVFTNFRWKFPTPLGQSMLHMGNVMNMLSGLLFGGMAGGLAAAIGSALFDLTSEYAAEAWITFINKFVMGYVCGTVATRGKKADTLGKRVLGVVCGTLAYQVLYQAKNLVYDRFVLQVEWQVVWADMLAKTIPNILLAVPVTIVASVALAQFIYPAIKRSGYVDKVRNVFRKDEKA